MDEELKPQSEEEESHPLSGRKMWGSNWQSRGKLKERENEAWRYRRRTRTSNIGLCLKKSAGLNFGCVNYGKTMTDQQVEEARRASEISKIQVAFKKADSDSGLFWTRQEENCSS